MRPVWGCDAVACRAGSAEDGSATILVTLLLGVATAVVAAVIVAAGSVVAAGGQAQDAADAAALAAAHAQPFGASAGRKAAGLAARTAGATLVSCSCFTPTVTVTVSVFVDVPAARRIGITHRFGTASAALIERR
ncbi:MAG: Flp pilus assembly protein TadG [Myxococcota bacterium]